MTPCIILDELDRQSADEALRREVDEIEIDETLEGETI